MNPKLPNVLTVWGPKGAGKQGSFNNKNYIEIDCSKDNCLDELISGIEVLPEEIENED